MSLEILDGCREFFGNEITKRALYRGRRLRSRHMGNHVFFRIAGDPFSVQDRFFVAENRDRIGASNQFVPQCDGGWRFLGRGNDFANLVRMFRNRFETSSREFPTRFDPRAKIGVGIAFRKDTDPVSQPGIERSDPRLGRMPLPFGMIAVEVSIVKGRNARVLFELFPRVRKQNVVREMNQIGIRCGMAGAVEGQRIPVQGTVGRVEVDGHGGIPGAIDPHHRPAFRRFLFDKIAIQVIPLRNFRGCRLVPGLSVRADAWRISRSRPGSHPGR